MKILVTYKSKTGFAKKYAEIIGNEVKANVLELGKVTANKMSEYDVIVYGGGLYAGSINGYKQAKTMFESSTAKEFVLFATGATPNVMKEKIEEVWKANLAEEQESIPHFYMQGGLCYEKMGLLSKGLLKMMASTLEKEYGYDENSEGPSIRSSHDISSKEYTEDLVNYLLKA